MKSASRRQMDGSRLIALVVSASLVTGTAGQATASGRIAIGGDESSLQPAMVQGIQTAQPLSDPWSAVMALRTGMDIFVSVTNRGETKVQLIRANVSEIQVRDAVGRESTIPRSEVQKIAITGQASRNRTSLAGLASVLGFSDLALWADLSKRPPLLMLGGVVLLVVGVLLFRKPRVTVYEAPPG